MIYENILTIGRNANDNILFEGFHGIGKSEIVENWAKSNDFYIETLFLSHYEIGDLIGSPYIENKTTYNAKPPFLKRLEEANKLGKHCVLFLDELNRANKDVLDAALQLCLKGEISEHKLPKLNGIKTFVVAAINPSAYYEVKELDAALLDRFTIIKFNPIFEDWIKWAKEHNIHKTIIDFLKLKPKKLHNFEEVYNLENSIAATPRSWKQWSDNLYELENNNLTKELLLTMAYGRIGNIAVEFETFYKNYNKLITKETIYKIYKTNLDDETNSTNILNLLTKNSIQSSQILEILKDMIKDIIKEDLQKIILFFLNIIPLEVSTAFLKDLQKKDKKTYLLLSKLDENLFQKIASIMFKDILKK